MSDITLHDHDTRMAAARRWAQWYLGDRSWADNIIDAYFNPDASDERVRKAKAKYEPVASGQERES